MREREEQLLEEIKQASTALRKLQRHGIDILNLAEETGYHLLNLCVKPGDKNASIVYKIMIERYTDFSIHQQEKMNPRTKVEEVMLAWIRIQPLLAGVFISQALKLR